MMPLTLCHVDDIPEGEARGFDLPQCRVFGVKKKNTVYLYRNRCPHLGIALEWLPHQFLDSEGLYIRCANHGAFFVPETGECIQGPCMGEALWAIEYAITDDKIMIPEEELPAPAGPA